MYASGYSLVLTAAKSKAPRVSFSGDLYVIIPRYQRARLGDRGRCNEHGHVGNNNEENFGLHRYFQVKRVEMVGKRWKIRS
jgi:hypothetical protein